MVSKPILSNKQTIARTVAWLRSHGLPALPVAPMQDAQQYPCRRNGAIIYDGDQPKPAFTGKNPSYLDESGQPHLLSHRYYQDRLPTTRELQGWFANPANGVMTMGGWGNIYWIDIDVKRYPSKARCDQAIERWLNLYPLLKNTLIEQTHSGGWRFAVRCQTAPDFTNFRLGKSMRHVGEILGAGRVTVLAPTIGPSGSPYVSIQRCEPITVESMQSIGIKPIRKIVGKEAMVLRVLQPIQHQAGVPHLQDLVCDRVKQILSGHNLQGDRSYTLLVAALELYGWGNWATQQGLSMAGNPHSLLLEAATLLGVEHDRVDRILKSQNLENCVPAIFQAKGGEATMQKFQRVIASR
jgi:hypothetical protein